VQTSAGRRTRPFPRKTRLALYRLLVELRYTEKRAYDLFLQNLVKGTSHLALGQEAVAAGFGYAMQKGRLHLLHLPRAPPHAGARRLDDRRAR